MLILKDADGDGSKVSFEHDGDGRIIVNALYNEDDDDEQQVLVALNRRQTRALRDGLTGVLDSLDDDEDESEIEGSLTDDE